MGGGDRPGAQRRQGVSHGRSSRRARGQADGFYEVAGHAGRRERARTGAQAHTTLSCGDQSRRETAARLGMRLLILKASAEGSCCSLPLKGEDHCEGLEIDLAFPGSAAAGENKAEAA
jgi:hypothetical protein